MILPVILLAIVSTQRVADGVVESVQASVDLAETEFRYVETYRFPNHTVQLRWRLRTPPESTRELPEGVRSSREMVRVNITDCLNEEGAKRNFDEALAEVGKDGVVKGLGDEAVARSQAGDDSRTNITFRMGRFKVNVSAPSGPIALRFAHAAAGSIQKLLDVDRR
jgi:hypothetical protein